MKSDLFKNPLISVVIPTRNRQSLVVRAVRSAMSQTLSRIEVIVVIDGPDQSTRESLESIDDPRIRIIELLHNVGAAKARNFGVEKPKSSWIAFLDDDDEWFENKLESQYQHAISSPYPYPIISCRLIKRDRKRDFIVPKRVPKPKEDISEYLFCRNNLFWGEGLIQTSTILTKKELLLRVPFGNVIFHDDLDWILRVKNTQGADISFVPDPAPLSIWNFDDSRERISNQVDWRHSVSWIRSVKNLITPRAHVSFLLTWASDTAAQAKNYLAFPVLLKEARKYGKPTLKDNIIWLYNGVIPRRIQRKISFFFHSNRITAER